ncbi:Polycomb group protein FERTILIZATION-INDEPENDENT ENDOSPERM, partial [Striga hermonthica]
RGVEDRIVTQHDTPTLGCLRSGLDRTSDCSSRHDVRSQLTTPERTRVEARLLGARGQAIYGGSSSDRGGMRCLRGVTTGCLGATDHEGRVVRALAMAGRNSDKGCCGSPRGTTTKAGVFDDRKPTADGDGRLDTRKDIKKLSGKRAGGTECRWGWLGFLWVANRWSDESVRLWNVHTGICILIFAGAGGHRNEVLSVDFHPSDIYRIASCGMDNTVKIWSMKEFWTYVEKSFTWTDLPSKFPTKYVQFPIFIASVHTNYVDCNRWIGDFILSKSVDSELVLWEPKMKEQSPGEGTVDILQKYPVPECDIWFIKFSCDFHYNAVAVGNREGKVFVWEVQSNPPVLIARLSHVQSKSPIRLTAVSFDGSTILCCCEDGTIWRWDVVAST